MNQVEDKKKKQSLNELLGTSVIVLNRSITMIDHPIKAGTILNITHVNHPHLPLDHKDQSFLFTHRNQQYQTNDVRVINLENAVVTLKRLQYVGILPTHSGAEIDVRAIDHDQQIIIGEVNIGHTDKRVVGGFGFPHVAVSIPIETVPKRNTPQNNHQNRTPLDPKTIDALLDEYNDMLVLYRIFGIERYKEQADVIMKKLYGKEVSENV